MGNYEIIYKQDMFMLVLASLLFNSSHLLKTVKAQTQLNGIFSSKLK